MLKIQELLHVCCESHKTEDGEEGGGKEGEGGKSADTDVAGKGKDTKDKTESKPCLGRLL